MADLKFKKAPVEENWLSRRWTYPKSIILDSGPYGDALRAAEALIRRKRPCICREACSKLRFLLVHECEMAKEWRSLWDSKDDPQRATAEWVNGSQSSLSDLAKLIDMLRAKDRLQGYDLRDIFYRSAQIAMSSAEKSSSMVHDPNLASGGFEVPTGGRIAQTVEMQLLARLFLGQFQQWLDTLQFEVDRRHEKLRLGRRIGPMFLDPPIDDASLARRDSSQLAILALVGRLRKALMIAMNCSGQSMPVYDSLSGKMPSGQIATWSVVHQLVWAAFPNAPDLPALKERWSSATKGREIRFSAWPQAVSRQATP